MRIKNTSGQFWNGICWVGENAAEEYAFMCDIQSLKLFTNDGEEMSLDDCGGEVGWTWETHDGSVAASLVD